MKIAKGNILLKGAEDTRIPAIHLIRARILCEAAAIDNLDSKGKVRLINRLFHEVKAQERDDEFLGIPVLFDEQDVWDFIKLKARDICIGDLVD